MVASFPRGFARRPSGNVTSPRRRSLRSGGRAHLLKAQGYRQVKSLFGGIAAWEEEGLPVARG